MDEKTPDYMARALELAQSALGTTSPNPAVGAVVVKEGRIVGEGFTQPPGQPHAEVMALRQAGEAARGATLYVSLEPCRHFGRTPPCTRAIIQAGIAQVHAAMLDPNPQVCGQGKAELEAAGIRMVVGEREEEAQELNQTYAKFITTGLPFVTAKFASSLDGKIATASGESRWITGEAARRYANRLRAVHDAVMVGVNTVLRDDPQLTARGDDGTSQGRQPLRVVVDGHGSTPPTARLLRERGHTLIAVAVAQGDRRRALTEAGAEVLALPQERGDSVDLRALLHALGQREVTSLLVEGGGTLLGSFFDLGLVDRVLAFVAPAIIGGRDAPSSVGGEGAHGMADVLRLERVKVEQVGEDVLVSGYPRRGG